MFSKIQRKRFFILLLAAASATLCAQQTSPPNEFIKPAETVRDIPANEGAAALWQSLLKLHTRASLMLFTAHPDDEDGGMLTMESRGMGVRVGTLTLNRGEGGQNVMSGDYDDALGLVRTQELLAADRYLGVDQMWSTVADFGFSKTEEESLTKWGHERVLYDAVRAVRLYRPLVVASVFIGGITDGHGQHQVAGEVAQEVFAAAGDPKVFPDQIAAGLQPWSPLKVYERVPSFSISERGLFDYATGKWSPARFYNYVDKTWHDGIPAANVTIHEGTYSPLLGMSYLQFARLGLGLQKSQNGGMGFPSAGAFDISYHRFDSRVEAKDDEKSFFDGIDTSVMGIAPEKSTFRPSLLHINELIEQAMAQYSAGSTEKIAPLLRDGLKLTTSLLDEVKASDLPVQTKYNILHELAIKQAQFNNALVEALGLTIRAQVSSDQNPTGPFARFQDSGDTFQNAIPGQKFHVQVQMVNPSGVPLKVSGVSIASQWGAALSAEKNTMDFANNTPQVASFDIAVPQDAGYTRPYFMRPDTEQPYYDIADPNLRGQSFAPYPLTAWAEFSYDGVPVRMGQIVQTAHRVIGQGTVYQPLLVVPAISVTISPGAGITPLSEKSFMLRVHVHSNAKGAAEGSVHLELPQGWQSSPEESSFHLARDGQETEAAFTVTPAALGLTAYTITAVAKYADHEYREGYHTVGYSGLEPYNLYRPATYRTRGVDVAIAPGLNVAYLEGTGDSVAESLENLGVHVHLLSMAELASADLSSYDAIVLGVRAYAAHPELARGSARLLDYARRGGVVIVQYNSREYDRNYGPYPYTLGGDGDRVVDETDAVTLLDPSHPLLTWPNHIGAQDFDGWMEERGHGFMREWDQHYEALTETHDPNQDQQRGGLLVAHYGEGAYVYVAYALYRQLPEGVPGAYRLFANLLSLKKNSAFQKSEPAAAPIK
jgi:LmbE family N-acetylglucosaminyl deacetylase